MARRRRLAIWTDTLIQHVFLGASSEAGLVCMMQSSLHIVLSQIVDKLSCGIVHVLLLSA